MNISIRGREVKITEMIKNEIDNSLNYLKKHSRFINENTLFNVEISYNEIRHYQITINAKINNKRHLHASVSNKDLFVAIKELIQPLISQLNHFKKTDVKNYLNASKNSIKNQEIDDEDFSEDE